MNLKLTHIVFLLLNTLFVSVLAGPVADDSRVAIPFEVINGLIIVEAEIDNEVGKYIFDTGAEELILNKEVRSGKTKFSSINGDIAVEEVNINLLKIGNLTHSKIKAYSADLGSMAAYLNISLHGVIGCNIFKQNKVKIDFESGLITLSTDKSILPTTANYVTFQMNDGVPVCPLIIDGKEYLFGFDTGATMHVIDNGIYDSLAQHFTDTGLDTYVSTGTGDKTINKIMSLDAYNLGNQRIENTQFLLQDMKAFNQSMEQPIVGVLSLTALGAESIVLDLDQKKIYF